MAPDLSISLWNLREEFGYPTMNVLYKVVFPWEMKVFYEENHIFLCERKGMLIIW